MKDIKKLKEELNGKYAGRDMTIRMTGSLRLTIFLHNVECIVTQKVLLIGNSDFINEEIEIYTDDINEISIDSDILLKMNGNYNIYIST